MQDRLDGLIPSQGYLAEFLRESRTKVWHNTVALQAARLDVPTAYAERLAELEVLSAARITDLLAPGQVLIRLAVAGFGVTLPPGLSAALLSGRRSWCGSCLTGRSCRSR